MDLIVESDIYEPCIDEKGNYMDYLPPSSKFKNGMRCPCGSRKDKTYNTNTIFSNHIKTKTHQKWLLELNTNKTNFYIENEKLKDTVQNQRIIISKLEKELQNKSMTVDYLTKQLTNVNNKVVNNLLEFD